MLPILLSSGMFVSYMKYVAVIHIFPEKVHAVIFIERANKADHNATHL